MSVHFVRRPGRHNFRFLRQPGCQRNADFLWQPGCQQIAAFLRQPGCQRKADFLRQPGCQRKADFLGVMTTSKALIVALEHQTSLHLGEKAELVPE